MSVPTMAKKKSVGKSDAKGSADKVTSVKCYASEQELIGKAAGVRGLGIAEFFREPDVRRFFLHVIVAAGQQAEKALEGGPTDAP